jgi:hypothetical protein
MSLLYIPRVQPVSLVAMGPGGREGDDLVAGLSGCADIRYVRSGRSASPAAAPLLDVPHKDRNRVDDVGEGNWSSLKSLWTKSARGRRIGGGEFQNRSGAGQAAFWRL